MFELRPFDKSAPYPGPTAQVTAVHTVVRDGWYNAFTDLIFWKDYYWLAYRRGISHNAANGVVVVLRSVDLRRWHEVKVFNNPNGMRGGQRKGLQDGHFCDAGDRLFLFYDSREPLGMFVSWTDNGGDWSPAQATRMAGGGSDVQPYTWHVRSFDGRFHSAVCLEEGPLDLIVSDDGVSWSGEAQIGPDPNPGEGFYTEESDLYRRTDGQMWCVVRTVGGTRLFWSDPPYARWHGNLKISMCDAPVMCELDGQMYIAGRCQAPRFWEAQDHRAYPQGSTGLFHLTQEGSLLLVGFPAGGDASYPGLVSTEPGKLVLAYYSDVAYWTGLIKPRSYPEYRYKQTDCDIYVAQIDVHVPDGQGK